MSNTLDRLKALNSKLEIKLSQKENRDLSEVAQNGKLEDPKPNTSVEVEQQPIVVEESSSKTLAENIIKLMSIDEKLEKTRANNIYRIAELYRKLDIDEKAPDFNNIFIYKAMNISGIGLKDEDFGEIREGKYTQIIAITYEPDKNGKKKAKNISLSYFGKAEKLKEVLKNEIIEFVLRWRYEKAFQNLEHYKDLLARIDSF